MPGRAGEKVWALLGTGPAWLELGRPGSPGAWLQTSLPPQPHQLCEASLLKTDWPQESCLCRWAPAIRCSRAGDATKSQSVPLSLTPSLGGQVGGFQGGPPQRQAVEAERLAGQARASLEHCGGQGRSSPGAGTGRSPRGRATSSEATKMRSWPPRGPPRERKGGHGV